MDRISINGVYDRARESSFNPVSDVHAASTTPDAVMFQSTLEHLHHFVVEMPLA